MSDDEAARSYFIHRLVLEKIFTAYALYFFLLGAVRFLTNDNGAVPSTVIQEGKDGLCVCLPAKENT